MHSRRSGAMAIDSRKVSFADSLEMVLKVQREAEQADVVGLDPAEHGLAAVSTSVGRVASERVPDDRIAERTEGDPATLRT